MQLKALFEEDSAVSPVIGVILMVAITVILAAVIATFVLGLGEQVSDTSPQASFNFDLETGVGSDTTVEDSWEENANNNDDSLLTIQHSGGPNIDSELLGVSGSTVEPSGLTGADTYADLSTANVTWDTMTAGDQVEVWIDDTDSVLLTWTSQDGTTSATLQRFEGPDA